TQPRPRAWWMELNGVGSATPTGKFVSAYNGDMNNIDSITVDKGDLVLVIVQPGRAGGAGRKMTYRARLAGGKLEGTFESEGQTAGPLKWTGIRAPQIPDRDDGSWKEGKPIALFN